MEPQVTTVETPEPTKEAEKTFTQKDIDTIIQNRVKDEQSKHQKAMIELQEKIKKDAELAQMTELDRIKTEKADMESRLKAVEDEKHLMSQKDETRNAMKEIGLNDVFLESVLVPKDSEKTKQNIEKIKKVFDEAVKQGIEANTKPHTPPAGGKVETDPYLAGFESNTIK